MATLSTAERLRRLLDEGRELSYADVEAQLGITERQARRLFKQIEAGGAPVRSRRDGLTKRFYLEEKDQKREAAPLEATPEEALALSVALRAARGVLGSTPLALPLEAVHGRLIKHLAPAADGWADLTDQQDRWHFGALALNHIDAEVFGTLLYAMEHGQSVRMDYQKPNEPLDRGRKIDPHCLAVIGNAVMVAAYCHRKRAVRDFSLPRIREAALCDPSADLKPYFDRQESFDPATYYDRFGAMTGGAVQVLRMLVEPACASFFEEREYHPSQDIEERRPDGRVVVSYEAVGFEEMKTFAQSWGAGVTVLDPPAMAEEIRQEAEAVAAKYKKEPEAQ